MAQFAHSHHSHKGELHGITVAINTDGPAVIGRCHGENEEQYLLLNVTLFEGSEEEKEAWILKSAKFGVEAELKEMAIAKSDVKSIRKLGEIGSFTSFT
jgi:hypothetical protein